MKKQKVLCYNSSFRYANNEIEAIDSWNAGIVEFNENLRAIIIEEKPAELKRIDC